MLNLKIVKPEPKYYRISFAMLNNILLNKKPIVKTESNSAIEKRVEVESKFATKFDKMVDMAIKKNLIDESDREMKLLEVQTLSEEEFDKYAKEVESEVWMDINNADPSLSKEEENLTEAEKALRKIKKSGPVIGDFSQEVPTKSNNVDMSNYEEHRSLADIKADRLMESTVANLTSESINGDLSEGMEALKSSLASNTKQKKVANHKKNPMSDLQGLTKPVVQQSVSFRKSLKDKFSDLGWSMGSR